MKENSNLEFSELITAFLRRIYLIDRNEKFCHGVTVSQCYLIEAIYKKGPVSMNELSSEMNLAISTLTRMLDILVRDKIAERMRSEKDRRKVLVRLSKSGIELYNRLKKCTIDYTNEIYGNIPKDNRDGVVDSIKYLTKAIDGFKIGCCKPGFKKEDESYDRFKK